jgi:hypothetical protein
MVAQPSASCVALRRPPQQRLPDSDRSEIVLLAALCVAAPSSGPPVNRLGVSGRPRTGLVFHTVCRALPCCTARCRWALVVVERKGAAAPGGHAQPRGADAASSLLE